MAHFKVCGNNELLIFPFKCSKPFYLLINVCGNDELLIFPFKCSKPFYLLINVKMIQYF